MGGPCAAPVADDQLQARQGRRAGEERVAAVVHALLAHVEQRELPAPREEFAHPLADTASMGVNYAA